ncbi:MAG TPA: glycoside hydrolase family 3 N-terminal domain-containing protein, partial [Methylocella sp.]|nr:glycoside hydrolase family 3 N-terminal domain-containing protein [Methylocella sp.]
MTRIDTLLAAMTLEEKIGQLNMAAAGRAVTGPVLARGVIEGIRAARIGSLLNLWGAREIHAVQKIAVEKTRLGIPLLIGFDVLHGHKTIFPIPLAEAASFDPPLWERSAREAAIEAAAEGIAVTFAPMLDIARDPRWGRIAEGPGEDPWVGAEFAKAKVRGFQGTGLAEGLAGASAVAATAKHFCAYGAALAGRDYASADVSERLLHEVYLPPFAAAVAAGCAAVMPAFNDVAGIPMTVHVPLLRDWLRRDIGFDGVIVSDYNAIAELLRHGVAGDLAEAAAAALLAG